MIHSFVAVEALETYSSNDFNTDEDVSMIALFDHEEVGSDSNPGAGSTMMRGIKVNVYIFILCLSISIQMFR